MSEMCRLPAELCESLMEQAYRPDEIMAWALGYACRVLEAYSDEQTAEEFNKESANLLHRKLIEFRKRKGMEVEEQ